MERRGRRDRKLRAATPPEGTRAHHGHWGSKRGLRCRAVQAEQRAEQDGHYITNNSNDDHDDLSREHDKCDNNEERPDDSESAKRSWGQWLSDMMS